ncbi:MAG: hypothetical protein WD672_01470 [Woeseia sp.]
MSGKAFSLRHSLATVIALVAGALLFGVLQTFIFGKHYLIPTGLLVFALLSGNIARYAYRGKPWAQHTAFWIGVLLTCHIFFALFWSVQYRRMLGAAFEPVAIVVTLVLAYLTWQYARRNKLFSDK